MRRRNTWARTVPASQTFCSESIWTTPPRNWTGRSKKYSATLLRCLSHWLRRQRSSKRSGKSTMNTSVNIGSTQDFRLSRALLVYGKSSYDAFPYRHPFIVVHEVIHDDDGARLAEGQLVTPQMRSEEHTSELQSLTNPVCRLLLGKTHHDLYSAAPC